MSGKSGKHTVIYGADTETDNNGSDKAWICQWAVVRMKDRSDNASDYTERHGYDLASMIAVFEEMLTNESTKHIVYFHNLKYDMQFFRGYLYALQERYKENDKDVLIIMRAGKPIILRFHNLEFRDSANKMPAGTTVRQMGDIIGIPKLESPRGNFNAGWSKDLTDDDFQYVIHDALIVGSMMQYMHSLGATHATASGDAWSSLQTFYNKKHNINGYGQFRKHYPPLSHGIDAELREGYFGGINVSQHIGIIDCEITTHEDVHSMYPTVIYFDLLPYGQPHKITTTPQEEGYRLWVISADMRFKLKAGMIPIYRFKHAVDAKVEGLERTSDPVESMDYFHHCVLTNVDLDTYSDFYDIEIDETTIRYYGFDSETGANNDYIDYWYEQKKTAPKNSVERALAKLMMNSCYGRFGLSDMEEITTFCYSEELQDFDTIVENSIADEIGGYLPFAMFVTAWARYRLTRNILGVGCENVIHCDTDSVIHLGNESPLGHTDALGNWGIESRPSKMYEGGVKRYIEVNSEDGTIHSIKDVSMACAGVPQKVDAKGCPIGMWLELLDKPERIYETGTVLGNEHYRVESQWLREILINGGYNPDDIDTRKLLPKKVSGGVLLVPTTFKMKDMNTNRYR